MTISENSEFQSGKIRSYRDLIVWRKGMDLVVETYRLGRALPNEERYVLKDQMLRASVSIPSNVAEGHGRMSKGEFLRSRGISRGSLHELETLFEVCQRVGYLDGSALSKAKLLADEEGRLLWRLMEKLGARRWK